MKITDMTREELRDYMKGNGSIHRYNSESIEWKHAFRLIKSAGFENLTMDCGKCADKVKTWLIK